MSIKLSMPYMEFWHHMMCSQWEQDFFSQASQLQHGVRSVRETHLMSVVDKEIVLRLCAIGQVIEIRHFSSWLLVGEGYVICFVLKLRRHLLFWYLYQLHKAKKKKGLSQKPARIAMWNPSGLFFFFLSPSDPWCFHYAVTIPTKLQIGKIIIAIFRLSPVYRHIHGPFNAYDIC